MYVSLILCLLIVKRQANTRGERAGYLRNDEAPPDIKGLLSLSTVRSRTRSGKVSRVFAAGPVVWVRSAVENGDLSVNFLSD